MSHILVSNIIKQANDAQPGWYRSDKLQLDEDAIQAVESSLALNAMPTPFAREEVVAQAFEIVNKKGFEQAGLTYKKLVSDVLDVFEILFHYKLYQDRISIVKCDIEGLQYKETNSVQVQANPNAINAGPRMKSYFKESLLNAINLNGHPKEIYFLVLDNSLPLAATSDKTVFFTTSRLDRNNGHRDYDKKDLPFVFKRRDLPNKEYFDIPVGLPQRDEDFRDFMCYFLAQNRDSLFTTPIGHYLDSVFQNIKPQDLSHDMRPLLDKDGQPVELTWGNVTLPLEYCIKVKSFELIKNDVINLRYSINSEAFMTIGDRDKNQLAPIDMEALGRLPEPNLSSGDLKRKAAKIEFRDGTSKQVNDIPKEDVLNFDFAVYPFFRYPKEYITNKLETYNVILTYKFAGGSIPENAIELRFYRIVNNKLELIPENDALDKQALREFFVDRRIRTDEKSAGNNNHRTVHYTIYGTNFDYIEVISNAPQSASGLVKPLFQSINDASNDDITFAVDFGTTSTHVACKGGAPFQTKPGSMVFLHGNPDSSNVHPVYKYENYKPSHDEDGIEEKLKDLVDYIQNEFIPTCFDGAVYKFPMRTAVSCKSDCKTEPKLILFGQANIASTYEKEKPRGGNSFIPNIKWAESELNLTSAYIRQIVKMCVNKAIAEGYKKSSINFVKFYPLSIGETSKQDIEDAWKEACSQYDINTETAVSTYSESLAPYYADTPEKARCAVSIDIGGGSVDFAVFSDGSPDFASSIRFGCDVLWSSFEKTNVTQENNPIFLDFVDKMLNNARRAELTGDNETIHVLLGMLGYTSDSKEPYLTAKRVESKYSSEDVINFWLGNNAFNFARESKLRKDFKPAFITHLYAILYHIAQVMKSEEKILPNALIFSGNGSKYLDYIGLDVVKQIAGAAFSLVYANDAREAEDVAAANSGITISHDQAEEGFNYDQFVSDLIIKVPNENLSGKEKTAVGGLKIRRDGMNLIEPPKKVYYGELLSEHSTYITKAKRDLVSVDEATNLPRLNEEFVMSICNNVGVMQTGLRNLFDNLQLSTYYVGIDTEECRTTLKQTLETNNDKTILGAATERNIQSTLFFVPIRKILFGIEEKVRNLTNNQ